MERHPSVDALAEASGHGSGLLLASHQLFRDLVQVIEFLVA